MIKSEKRQGKFCKNMSNILWHYVVIVNLLSYLLMWKDKKAAKNGGWRIAENHLLRMAVIGGSAGIYLGMCRPLYHKAGKRLFKLVIPLIFLIQSIAIVFYLME